MVARIAGSMMVCVAVLIVVSFLVSLGVLWLTGNVITSAAIGTIGGSAAAFAVDTLNTVVEGAGEQLSHENYRSGSSRTPPNSNCATNHSARQPSTPAIQGNVVLFDAPYSDLAPWHRASFSTSWTSCLASRASPISAKTADVILVPHCSYAQLRRPQLPHSTATTLRVATFVDGIRDSSFSRRDQGALAGWC